MFRGEFRYTVQQVKMNVKGVNPVYNYYTKLHLEKLTLEGHFSPPENCSFAWVIAVMTKYKFASHT